mmetsp:Transcript_97403/g.253983  ORF Transcript_97403/g.253983 Transcript_97403/m.253983 type:complete len:153 (+) Transcript_97403:73-531(+)
MSPSIPKVAIPQEKWPATIYGTADAGLAKSEVGKLQAMQFDTTYWSKAYLQCIGRGVSSKECAAGLPDDVRTTPAGPLAGNKELTAAISCMSANGTPEKCQTHFDALAVVAGYEAEVKQSSTEKAREFAGKAGYKLLGIPALWYAMKFVKIK